jgi:osmotically-inducible protein OsmY
MQEHEGGRPRPSDPRRGQRTGNDQYQNYAEDESRSMTTRSTTAPQQGQDEWSGIESGGGWSGYVVPYRYYGPGYRGVGYYTVLYQGGGEGGDAESESQHGQPGRGYSQSSGWDAQAGAFAGSQSGRGFAGRGPKGYQRSDERLREEVSDRLMADDRIDASDIDVHVQDGEVTLTGAVTDRLAKRRAEDCAEAVMGVRDVMNQLRVQTRGVDSQGTDQGGSGMTSGSRSRQGSTSSGQADTDRGSDGERSTGANGRRRTTSSSR